MKVERAPIKLDLNYGVMLSKFSLLYGLYNIASSTGFINFVVAFDSIDILEPW